ncbi:MAG TPA: thiol peroxidase [Candidatus Hydrogenedentes bacterium]|jgi:thiol peroxidase|nr:thiol peroxidase [Candidatus Hydrogenedentota bacterium]
MSDRSVTLKGNPLALEGPELKVGDAAPSATLKKDLVNDISLDDFQGKARVYSVVPSVDTPVCAEQTKRFNEEAGNLEGVEFITISCDLPVALARFCGAESIGGDGVSVLSDHRDTDFGKKYGTLIPDLRILCRAVFVVGSDDKLAYVEYVPEIAEHPNYDAIVDCAKGL